MELQERLADFERAGIALFAISYDPVPVLRQFADKRGIAFPLLSDEGSRVIRELGLLNEHLAAQARFYGLEAREHQRGVPYPGVFVLDEDGAIVEKQFEQSYRPRPSPARLLEDLGAEPGPAAVSARAEREGLRIEAWLDQDVYHPYEQMRVHVALTTAPGLHVYGQPIPEGYTPLVLALAPDEALVQDPPLLPEPRPFRVEGLDEQFRVYKGRVEATIPFRVEANRRELTLRLEARWQACTETLCHPPDRAVLELPLKGLDLIRD